MTTCAGVLAALLAWGALSFGAVYPWGYWPLAAGGAGVGLWCIAVTRAWREPRPRRLAVALGAIAIAIACQVVPLPYAWFRALSPGADAVLSQLVTGWTIAPPDWHSLSIAPEGTVTALVLFVAFAVLLVGLTRAVAYMPPERVIAQMAWLGLALALIGIVQRVTIGAADMAIYGLWQPSESSAPFGPFINRNHFAGWMVMALPVVLATVASRLDQPLTPVRPGSGRQIFSLVTALLMAVALVLTGSRSGLIGLAGAVLLLVFVAPRGASGRRRTRTGVVSALVVVVAVAWVGTDRVAARFGDAASEVAERMVAWADTLALAADFPLAGTGMGGYGAAMLVYQTAARHSIYAQAHNEYLQVVAEGGLLVAVPTTIALGVIAGAIRHRRRVDTRPRSAWVRAGAIAGLGGIGIQSILDFSLQMPGNTILFVLLLALAMHRPSSLQPDAYRV